MRALILVATILGILASTNATKAARAAPRGSWHRSIRRPFSTRQLEKPRTRWV
jgi:hypothetical protein